MNSEKIQSMLFDAYDLRDKLPSNVKRWKMDNEWETVGEVLDNLIEFLAALEETIPA
jgi:hypothetical protein